MFLRLAACVFCVLAVTPASAHYGDTNGDGRVDLIDLNNVRNNFGGFGLGDTDDDGDVDLSDLNLVRNTFGAAGGGVLAIPLEN